MRYKCEVNKVVRLKKGFYATKLGFATLLNVSYNAMCYYLTRGLPVIEINKKTMLIEVFKAWEWLKERNYLADRAMEIEKKLSSIAEVLKNPNDYTAGIVLSNLNISMERKNIKKKPGENILNKTNLKKEM